MTDVMPAIFLGHGNPMNAMARNEFTEAWQRMGEELPRPKAILSISAHWYVPASRATAGKAPRTIHDFLGFPEELYEIQYPAAGNPELANRLTELLLPVNIELNSDRGLDHGTWAVLRHVYPAANVPVVQLSIDSRKPPSFHYEMGKRLAPLRKEGVLIMGSGNLVHNLQAYAWDGKPRTPYEWAVRFENVAKKLMIAGEFSVLVDYQAIGRDALLSVPTPDHYLPMLYVLGAAQQGERVRFPVEGFDGGSISMLAIQLGESERNKSGSG